jgi:hypothetical protein
LDRQVAAGALERDGSGAIRATAEGHAFLVEVYRLHNHVTGTLWTGQDERIDALNPLLVRLIDAAAETGGLAFAAMAPPYPHPVATGASLLLDRLGTLRYHRADAHAAAWRAAGLTAAGIVALTTGTRREEIEAGTNRLAAPPWAALTSDERAVFLDHLSAMPG